MCHLGTGARRVRGLGTGRQAKIDQPKFDGSPRGSLFAPTEVVTVGSVAAGAIDVAACSFDGDAVRIMGLLLADGTGPSGTGGSIRLDARSGGIWLPGVDKCLATGEAGDGGITLMYRTALGPDLLNVSPDPVLVPDGPDNGPCSCSNSGGGDPK